MKLEIEEISALRSFVFLWCGSGEGLDLGRMVIRSLIDLKAHNYCVYFALLIRAKIRFLTYSFIFFYWFYMVLQCKMTFAALCIFLNHVAALVQCLTELSSCL